MRILVIVMGVVSLFFFFFLFGFGSMVIFFVGWLLLGFLDFFGVGGQGKVCIKKR